MYRKIENISVVYHNKDIDGITSGALLKQAYPHAKLHGYDHSEPINFELEETVIFADIGFKIDQMYNLSKSHNIIWIDHHVSSYDKYKKKVKEVGYEFCEIIYDNTHAACVNVFNWLYPDKYIPTALQLISDYDIHKNFRSEEWYEETLPFQFGMRAICNTVDTFPIDELFNEEFMYALIDKGNTIVYYQNTVNELACRKNSFDIEFHGYRAVCLNIADGNLDTFKSVYNQDDYDMVMTFYFDGGKWHIYMYTDKDDVNCSEIAVANGGGGHIKAAGFEIHNINWLLDLKK